MRTNIEIDDALMRDAMRSGTFASKREAVETGLRLLAQRGRYRELLALRGKLEWGDSPAGSPTLAPPHYALQEPRAAYNVASAARSTARRKSAK
jgi:Bacterial antitoxin of type II TA system, VapB